MREWGLWFLVCWFVTGVASADTPLRIDQSGERMRVDGALREWRGAHFTLLSGAGDTTVRYALATADGGLYVGADVRDDQLVRSGGVGPKQDALVLTLAMPDNEGSLHTTEIWLHPGDPGHSRAEAGIRAGRGALHAESRIKVVEGPREQDEPGYVLEAFIPWSLVEDAEIWEQGRGSLRLEDVDAGGKTSVLASAASESAKAFPRLALGVGHKDFLGSFLSSQNLVGVEPRYDLRGNVYGGPGPERVVLVDRFVMVYGPEYQNGESYGFLALPVGMGGGIKQAELTDLTGDGREELVVTLRQRNDLGSRELWMIYSLAEATPRVLFGVELKKEASGGFVENELRLERRGRGIPRIEVKVGRVQNLDASSLQESAARDVQPILLPWGPVRARTYGFDGSAFAVLDEDRVASESKSQAAPAVRLAAAQTTYEEPLPPTVEAVLALFKKDRKLPAKLAPRRHQHGNFLGGPASEQLFELGTQLVLVGPDVGGGGGYVAYGLPVKDPADTVYLGHADVTADGREEIFVRIKQPLSGADGVYREIVLVLRADAQGKILRALAAEVTRRQAERVIANRVVARPGKLVIEPGSASGWDASNYPFTNEATGGVEKLRLPWADGPQSYRLRNEQLVPDL